MHEADTKYLRVAVEQAKLGLNEGGIPIGAVLVVDGKVIATGRNRRVQQGSAIHHGETDCLENAGRLPAVTYAKATLYTTLSPCPMCAGAILLYKIPRVVMGEHETFMGAEDWLKANGVEVVNANSVECKELMKQFVQTHPEVWNEDIGMRTIPGSIAR